MISGNKKAPRTGLVRFSGAPWGIRTLDVLIRSQSLYPAEVRAHVIKQQQVFLLKRVGVSMSYFTHTEYSPVEYSARFSRKNADKGNASAMRLIRLVFNR